MSLAVAHVKHLYRTEDNGHWTPVDRRVASCDWRLATGDWRQVTSDMRHAAERIFKDKCWNKKEQKEKAVTKSWKRKEPQRNKSRNKQTKQISQA